MNSPFTKSQILIKTIFSHISLRHKVKNKSRHTFHMKDFFFDKI